MMSVSKRELSLPGEEPDTDSYPMQSLEHTWIAVEPPLPARGAPEPESSGPLDSHPPSFESAQYDIVLRRQRQRPSTGGGVKCSAAPSRFINLPSPFEFSGWGTMSRLELGRDELTRGEEDVQRARGAASLGQFTASAIAGNAVLGSVFYALPAVASVSGVYSPISLSAAGCVLFLWRPIMEELASALPISGAPYTYLLNVSSKTLALIGAALLLLDFSATAVVSAATAMSYLGGEVTLPFSMVCEDGIRDYDAPRKFLLKYRCSVISADETLSRGNTQIRTNWVHGTEDLTAATTARAIFDGICLGVLGLTGFECVPSYVSSIKPGKFPQVLRNLHYPALLLNSLAMLFVLAHVPLGTIVGQGNILSVLAQTVAGKWLRTWVVVDAVIVLCGGVLTGILGACELFERLARDRFLPRLFTFRLPGTGSPACSVAAFVAFSCVLYASSGARLDVMSKMFSLVWLTVMALFPLSVLLLKFSRGRLTRTPRTPLFLAPLTLAVAAAIIGGNIAVDPSIVGYAAAYFLALAAAFQLTMKKVRVLHGLLWAYDQYRVLTRHAWTRTCGENLAAAVSHLRKQPVCVLVKTDEINVLIHSLLYVSQNEETSCLKLVHFYDDEIGVPSEMEANWKILDEAFPEITVDLILVRETFTPSNVAALAHRLEIPTTLMFMSCPGRDFPFGIAELGTRIISL
ncbi:uncharacterized protein PHACADRAFT_212012 [Phanerochaete carnosa HHB-10118-sp]|uniref:Amino acid permease/ SLC12A domain-containing protein n=1 Tax=Phanerochaete carnosa (strain HHB-10118-sp) TaxID=650164 RepID=K5USE8_PHACS|nr:uncharacterized protein PHACADRAFT_212012 [Phanerochaete carnosa HHB-10118-sp]EKM52801.1 hypothetical protein PHACADRAFT_212012 [Phanerochaete carnosa HHB-10118-sp]